MRGIFGKWKVEKRKDHLNLSYKAEIEFSVPGHSFMSHNKIILI